MIQSNRIADASIGDDDLIDGLKEGLDPSITRHRSIRQAVRRASSYQSSYPLEELTVIFDNGEPLDLVFKNVSPRALSPPARRAKPEFLDDPCREIGVYRTILAPTKMGTPHYYGSLIDEANDRYWLFLENVVGQELYQIGEMSVWLAAARWLARFHRRFASLEAVPRKTTYGLKSLDEPYHEQWYGRAVRFTSESHADASRRTYVQRLAELAPQVIGELLQLPTTVIHGEFYASNVIIDAARQPVRVSPLDWERTAIGPGLIDLAALVAGNWPEEAKCQMAIAYHDELSLGGDATASLNALLGELNLCRLQLAVQWLGWSADWTPPKQHRHDWLAEAIAAARNLGFAI
jgi:Ser/Thr protein kinase RdoA (MazF antagonist)